MFSWKNVAKLAAVVVPYTLLIIAITVYAMLRY